MIIPSHNAILCFSKGPARPLPGLRQILTDEVQGVAPTVEFLCNRSGCMAERTARGRSDKTEFSDLWYDIHRLKHNSRRVDHPCQLPPAIMRRLFALFTEPKELVLDCFNGAGTSTLVAHQMGRRFVGIEVSEYYHRLASERHKMIEHGDDPFAKRNETPAAKNSRVERLPKQRYAISKKSLQLEIRRIAQTLGHIPSRDEVQKCSQYPISYFDDYFISWGEACAAARHAGMSESPVPELLRSQQLNLL